jgi:hypothetical protein
MVGGRFEMELRTRLLGTAGLILAIVLGVALIGGSDDEDDGGGPPASSGTAIPGEKAPTASFEQLEGGKPAPKPAADEPYKPPPGSDEEEVAGTIDGTYEALEPGRDAKRNEEARTCDIPCDRAIRRVDKKKFCDLMTEEAQQETKTYGLRISGSSEVKTCEDGIHMILRRSVQISGSLAETLDVEIVGINVDGETATASIRRGKTISTMSLVKEDGEWKMPATPSWNAEEGKWDTDSEGEK